MDEETWSAQAGFGVRFEWGPVGAARLVEAGAAALVVVDVLSFTTAVSVAVERGTRVYPYPWRDGSAREFAAGHAADLAVGRREASTRTPWSLSPAALRAAPFTPRLVLPSPNGSAIAAAAEGLPVYAACLRNATAVARHLYRNGYGAPDRPVAVVAAGERWPDGSLRPAVEDLLGAGAVIAALPGAAALSPEAALAAATARATPDPAAAVRACASGRELADGGWPQDVEAAVEIDSSAVVPLLDGLAFGSAR